MEKMQVDLKNRFSDLWQRLGAKGNFVPVFNRFAKAYSQSHRRYHVLDHPWHCLKEFDAVRHLFPNAESIEWTFCWHDFIYNTRRDDNEEKSADDSVDVLQKHGVARSIQKDSWRQILVTKHNMVPHEEDEKVVVDIDLSIFGQPRAVFDNYELQIRKEYSWVDEDLFRRERKKIIQGFWGRKTIYFTEYFREKYEAQAQRNLQWSLRKLG